MASDIVLRVDLDRVKDSVTVNEMIGMQRGNFAAIRNVVSRFVVDENGNYVPEEEAQELIGEKPLRVLEELSQEFRNKIEETAVPPKRGRSSD
jgi:hypothetical protein